MSDNTYSGGQPYEPPGGQPADQGWNNPPPDFPPPTGSPTPPQQGGQYPTPPGQAPGGGGQYPMPPGQPAGGGYGQMPHQVPVSEPPKKRRRWLWIVLGVLGFFILLIGGCTVFLVNAVSAPIDATNEYVARLDDGDYQGAYDSLCSSARSSISAEDWIALVREGQPGEITGYNFSSASVNSSGGVSTAEVSGTIEFGSDVRTITYNLLEEDGEWRICDG